MTLCSCQPRFAVAQCLQKRDSGPDTAGVWRMSAKFLPGLFKGLTLASRPPGSARMRAACITKLLNDKLFCCAVRVILFAAWLPLLATPATAAAKKTEPPQMTLINQISLTIPSSSVGSSYIDGGAVLIPSGNSKDAAKMVVVGVGVVEPEYGSYYTAGVLNELSGTSLIISHNHEGKQHKFSYTLSKETKFCGGEGNVMIAEDFKVGDIVTVLAKSSLDPAVQVRLGPLIGEAAIGDPTRKFSFNAVQCRTR